MNLTLNNGFISDYDDFYLWVEAFEEYSKAYVITKDEDGEATSAAAAKIVKLIDHSDYENEDDYSDAVDDLMNEDSDYTGEFMTMDGICYVAVEIVEDEKDLEEFEIGPDVNYC